MARSAVFIVPLIAACADLVSFEQNGACGNKIIEAGEDCDTFDDGPIPCGKPGQFGACRLLCDPFAREPACPSAAACGIDGICRYASGELLEPTPIALSFTDQSQIERGDLDGDRRMDLVVKSGPVVEVFYGSSDAAFERGLSVDTLTNDGPFAIGRFDEDEIDDLAVWSESGFVIARGASDRRLVPVIAPSQSSDSMSLLAAMRGSSSPLRELLEISVEMNPPALLVKKAIEPRDIVGRVPLAEAGSLQDRYAIGDIDRIPGFGEEIALYTRPADAVEIVSLSCDARGGCVLEPRTTVQMPRFVARETFFAQVDGDRNMDLAAVLVDDTLAVAYGDGRGGFCSVPAGGADCEGLGGVVNRASSIDAVPELYGPIAVADFDADGRDDFVTRRGIVLNDALESGSVHAAYTFLDGTPSSAEIGDFDDDHLADAAVIRPNETVELFYGSAGRVLRRARIASPVAFDPLTRLDAGDVDGNGTDDLVLAASGGLYVIYGKRDGAPSDVEAAGVGELPFAVIDALVIAPLSSTTSQPDLVADIAIRGDGNLVLMSGSTQRLLLSASPVSFSPRETVTPRKVFADRSGASNNLLIVSQGATKLWIANNDGAGRFLAQPAAVDSSCPRFFVDGNCDATKVIDLERDGVDELIAHYTPGCAADLSGTAIATLARIDGTAITCEPVAALPDRGTYYGRMAVADVTGDAIPDAIYSTWHGREAGPAGVMDGRTRSFVPIFDLALGATPLQLDGDPEHEVAVIEDLRIAFFDGSRTSALDAILRAEQLEAHQVLAIDADGDGVEDLLLIGESGSVLYRQKPK